MNNKARGIRILIRGTAPLLLITANLVCNSIAVEAQTSRPNPPAAPDVIETYSGNDLLGTPEELAENKRRVDESDAYAQQGHEFMRKKNFTAAIVSYQMAISSRPDPICSYQINLAEAYNSNGQVDEAIKAYRAYIYSPFKLAVLPKGSNFVLGLNSADSARYGLLLVKKGQWAEAIQCHEAAITRLFPKDQLLYRERFFLNNLNKKHLEAVLRVIWTPGQLSEEAVAECRKAIALWPTYALGYFHLGRALTDTDKAGARAAYKEAIRLGHGAVREKATAALDVLGR